MDEHVLAAAFRSDEAETFCGIEEFDCTDCHFIFLYLSRIPRAHMRERAWKTGHQLFWKVPIVRHAQSGSVTTRALRLTGRKNHVRLIWALWALITRPARRTTYLPCAICFTIRRSTAR